MRNRTAVLAAAAALAATALVGSTTTGATAQQQEQQERNTVPVSEVVPDDDLARMTEQQPLVAAADKIRWAQENAGFAGFTGIGLEEGRVALWWKGAIPATMRKAIGEARRIAPVRVVEADYSFGELKTASARLQEQLAEDPSLGHTVKIPTDGSGLVLAREGTSIARSAVQSRAIASDAAGVPVSTVVEEPLQEASRQSDSPPWWGGSIILKDNGVYCTSGFGVTDSSGAEYILTAEHCGTAGERFSTGSGAYIGTPVKARDDHDVMLIQTSDVQNYTYTGNQGSNVGVRVDGWDWTYPGEYLCQSGFTSAGATGGPVCNIKVLFYWNDSEDLVEGEQMDGQEAARSGDSGGPLYAGSASGGTIAKGTVTRSGGSRIGFQDFGTAWRDFGIWIAS
ncbi:hypothetical protein [Streptomyces sp. NPDC047042]|uniref:hypothetical protein n=1 Tax=Streptomyces sp. NPDC047042 TaxID=3154807 RepID=UPI0033E5B3B6